MGSPLHDNAFLHLCAIISLFAVVLVLVATFVPQWKFDHEVDYPNAARAVMVVLILGLLRGAF